MYSAGLWLTPPTLGTKIMPVGTCGAMTAITGQRRYNIRLHGQANHAGTTRMCYRHDVVQVFAQIVTEAIAKANAKAASRQPFMATILTVSNHPPYVIPDFFHPKSADKEDQIVEYVDWAVGDFLAKARREPWYSNTVFVLLGDHGKLLGDNADSELPQSLNHIPLIMFGAGVPQKHVEGMASQVDVMPTLLGLLGMSYYYDGFGYDLLRQDRGMVQYTSDDQIVARDSSRCLIYNHSTGRADCYLVEPNRQLRKTGISSCFDSLRRFALSTEQTADFVYRREH